MSPAHRLLDAAAAPTLERIHRDRQKAPSQLQPLLAYLETHLFDPDLDANQLKRACGVRDNSLPIYFHHALSLPPYAYIEDCRLEVACRLLRDTELKVWQIAQLLGYSTLQVFSRAFDRWSGLRPSVFRRRSKLEAQAVGNGNGAAHGKASETKGEDSLICLTKLRKAVNGALEEDEAAELACRLVQLYPKSFDQAARTIGAGTAESPAGSNGSIQLSAEQAWTLIESRPRQEQLSLVQGRCQMASVELFHLLVEKGMEETRRDISRGVEIAALAVDCLEALAGTMEEDEYKQLEVKGCSWLANSYRFAASSDLAYDFSDVEKALAQGANALRPSCDPHIRVEFMLVSSAARMSQRRVSDALDLANECVAIAPALQDSKIRVRIWSHRANILYVMGRVSEGIADLWRAYGLIDDLDDPYLQASVYQSLSHGLVLEGRSHEARRYLPIAKSLCQEHGLDLGLSFLKWTEGLMEAGFGHAESAEKHLRASRQGFYEQGLTYGGALVALDLALFCTGEGRLSEAQSFGLEVIEVFEGLNVPQEVLKAIQVLQHAVRTESLCKTTLQRVRSTIGRHQPSSS